MTRMYLSLLNWILKTVKRVHVCVSRSIVSDSATRWTVACQAPPSIEFSRQEYWSGLPFPSPGDLPKPGIKPRSSALQADSLLCELAGNNKKRVNIMHI